MIAKSCRARKQYWRRFRQTEKRSNCKPCCVGRTLAWGARVLIGLTASRKTKTRLETVSRPPSAGRRWRVPRRRVRDPIDAPRVSAARSAVVVPAAQPLLAIVGGPPYRQCWGVPRREWDEPARRPNRTTPRPGTKLLCRAAHFEQPACALSVDRQSRMCTRTPLFWIGRCLSAQSRQGA